MTETKYPKRLKILFVSNDKFPPFRVDVAVLFGKEIVGKGHQIDWVLQSESDCKKGYKTSWGGGTAWVGPTNNGANLLHRLHKHLLGFFHNVRCSRSLFNKNYDCVQIKDRFFSAIIYLALARLIGLKGFFWLSYPFPEASLYQYRTKSARYPFIYLIRGVMYKWILYKIIMLLSHHVFVQSEQMKKDVAKEGIEPNKMTVIPMGFDPDSIAIDAIEISSESARSEKKVLYLGTLNRLRKIDFIIRMFAEVIKNIPEARLYLVGKADAEEDIDVLRTAASDLGILESIVFTGFVERHKAFEMIKSADVCISPFYPTPVLNSTSPTKLIEYMAIGRSVVANDHPEQKLVILESGAGICVPYHETDFAQAVVYLLLHPEMRKRMGVMGKMWAYKNRSYSFIAECLERVYYNLIEGSGSF